MKKIALIAALPVALTLAACGETGGEDTADMGADATAPMDAGTSVEGTETATGTDAMADGGTMTDEQRAEQLDESAENLEERADRIEDTNEAEADRLEAQAKAQQEQRDAID